MEARYSKFLQTGLKVYGIEVKSFYMVILVWLIATKLEVDNFTKLFVTCLTIVCIYFYKSKFPPNYFYFFIRKRKYTKFLVKESFVKKLSEKL